MLFSNSLLKITGLALVGIKNGDFDSSHGLAKIRQFRAESGKIGKFDNFAGRFVQIFVEKIFFFISPLLSVMLTQ